MNQKPTDDSHSLQPGAEVYVADFNVHGTVEAVQPGTEPKAIVRFGNGQTASLPVNALTPTSVMYAASDTAPKEPTSTKPTVLDGVLGDLEVEGKVVQVSRLDLICSRLRQSVTATLKHADPAGYATYREMKYASGPKPTIEQRRAAYEWAFRRLLQVAYRHAGV